ncbi:MAG TPA: 3-isopropylmalate dehydratase small subunit [Kiritimatiellia bacterium]|nr:3-isopropylmalate dehydratase small subunit [Kiritimatiellia bacterium]HPR69097.1 3-isopropylmalate dehydratase small subunit [Kiritimatiellia bacterium]HRX06753.1 3-isopropylmalate dehydratase small subunit [Kiritimatiellia bacterium]
MDAFKTFTGTVAVLERANVDTDQIIPKQFLKSIERTGFGPALFFDWRYLKDGSPDPAFELNDPLRAGASVLVAGNNFGCGSSREHAVWAVAQYGFKAVIAPWRGSGEKRIPGFADIFKNNSYGNGLLVIELSSDEVQWIFDAARGRKLEATVDLEAQTVTVRGAEERVFRFDITPDVKEKLLSGLDAIGLTLQHEAEITAFEATHDVQMA